MYRRLGCRGMGGPSTMRTCASRGCVVEQAQGAAAGAGVAYVAALPCPASAVVLSAAISASSAWIFARIFSCMEGGMNSSSSSSSSYWARLLAFCSFLALLAFAWSRMSMSAALPAFLLLDLDCGWPDSLRAFSSFRFALAASCRASTSARAPAALFPELAAACGLITCFFSGVPALGLRVSRFAALSVPSAPVDFRALPLPRPFSMSSPGATGGGSAVSGRPSCSNRYWVRTAHTRSWVNFSSGIKPSSDGLSEQ
mmetsp:Transcript_59478/g.106097  ORF Transcript_59478/g.106097 Transcript_59478/m.106097 type:complete len:256 (-) Transcript_59478:1047-1814(-)